MDPARRALSDEKYQQMAELVNSLPAEAREPRFAIFDANPRTGVKRDYRPLEKILFSRWKELNLSDQASLAGYLEETWEPGHYIIEAHDEHGMRISKIPSWTVSVGNDEEQMNEPRRRRFSHRDDVDFDDDEMIDDRETRANAADLLSVVARTQNASMQAARSDQSQLMTVLMTTQQAADARRVDEERRRDDQRAEERRREEARAEERRREEREEQRRYEEKLEREREERRAEERRSEERRREEASRQIEASNRRTELLVGALTSALPILTKVFEKKEDPILPILLKMGTEKKDADPVTMMLMKSILDKANSDDASKILMQNMVEMTKVSSQMNAEQMKSIMALSSDMNQVMMKKAMEMMMASPQGQTEEGKSMIEQIMGALSGASEIVKAIMPAKPVEGPPLVTAQPSPAPAQPASPARHRLTAPAVGTTPAVEPVEKSAEELREEYNKLSPEEQQKLRAQVPKGVKGTLVALQAIQEKRYQNQAELQGLVGYAITCMPEDLRQAVCAGDEMGVVQIAMPVIESEPALKTWVQGEGVLNWLRSYVAQLGPSIEAIRQQEAQAAAPAAPAPAPSAEEPAPAPVADSSEAPAPKDGESDLEITPPTEPAVNPPSATTTGSHLDDESV